MPDPRQEGMLDPQQGGKPAPLLVGMAALLRVGMAALLQGGMVDPQRVGKAAKEWTGGKWVLKWRKKTFTRTVYL